jgi:hypothetical protein
MNIEKTARRGIKAVMVAAVALGGAACSGPAPECEVDANCASYAFCDAELGRCFFRACSSNEECGAEGRCNLGSGFCEAHVGDEDAGIDGGPTCEPACAAHQECGGSGCVARYSGVELVAPLAGVVAGGAMVPVRARLTLVSGRTENPPESIEVTLTPPSGNPTSGVLMKSGSEYLGTVALGTAEGAWTVQAQYEAAALASDLVPLTVDATAPVFTVTVAPAPTRPPDGQTTYVDPVVDYAQAWKRAEVAKVYVSSSAADVDAPTVTVRVRFGTDGEVSVPVLVRPSVECDGATWCGLAEVALWKPEMNAFRADLTLRARGSDLVGNESQDATGKVKVTRWKWAHQFVGASESKATPALDAAGDLYVGIKTVANSGQVFALRPDGTVKWGPLPVGAVTASAAVGSGNTSVVYVPVEDAAGGSILALSSIDGSVLASCPVTGTIKTALAVSVTQRSGETQVHETATGVANTAQELISIRPTATISTRCLSTPAGADANEGTNMVAHANAVFYGDALGAVRGFSFGASTWDSMSNFPVGTGLFPRGLAVAGTDLVGGGGGGPGQGGVFSIPTAGGVPDGMGGFASEWEHSTTSPAWSPVVDASERAYVGLENGTLLRAPLKMTGAVTPGTEGVVQAAPVLGQGGWVYLATRNGRLVARRTDALSDTAWLVEGLGTIEGSPTIDCGRGEGGAAVSGAPGVLYVPSNNGKLYAFHVDSRGLDTSAAWPKFQRDPRNSGRGETSLAAFACP